MGLSSITGKDFPFPQRIDQIKRAQFGIYEVSNPEHLDTFIELGAAIGLGKKVHVIFGKGSLPPETIKPLDPIEYDGLPSLTERLRKAAKL